MGQAACTHTIAYSGRFCCGSGHYLGWDLQRTICSIQPSAYSPHLVFLAPFLTISYWLQRLIASVSQAMKYSAPHPQVLTLPPVPQDKEENSSTTAHVICQVSLAHLAFCLVDNDRCRWYSPEQHQIKLCKTAQNLRYIWSMILFFSMWSREPTICRAQQCL